MNDETDNTIDCDEWIDSYRRRQIYVGALFMVLVYGLYIVLDLFLTGGEVARPVSMQYLLFSFSLFLIVFIFAYRQNNRTLTYFVPIVIAIGSMVVFRSAGDIHFYFAEMGILIVWIFTISGLRFRQALVSSTIVLLIIFYSVLIYSSQDEPSMPVYLFLLVVLFILSALSASFIEELSVELCIKALQNQELSMTDELTELPSRAKFDFIIKSELERSRRYKYRFGLMMIEIDDFKTISNKFGKDVRDDLLIVVSSMITEQVRSTDMEIRWSEHEFVVVCLELDIVQLRKIANSILQSMIDYDFGRLGDVTLSIGATINKVSDNDTSIVNRAKQALFKARHNNGNSVETL
jgi:diguanylate cyclase (GGDEF)-like protein